MADFLSCIPHLKYRKTTNDGELNPEGIIDLGTPYPK